MKDDRRLCEEYDPPLPKRVENPTKEDKEKLEMLLKKYGSHTNKINNK